MAQGKFGLWWNRGKLPEESWESKSFGGEESGGAPGIREVV